MKRLYELAAEEHLLSNRQMLFLVGPRQVGKTTTSLEVSDAYPIHCYINWDIQRDRLLILQGADAVADFLELKTKIREKPLIVVFDELHKYGEWKIFIKGFFDKYSKEVQIIVTGSARLDVYKMGGDSLMGRYFQYRIHPLSVAEIIAPILEGEISSPTKIDDEVFQGLFNFGGFPEPYLKQSKVFYNRWKKLRSTQLFQEDIRDLTKIQEIGQIQILAELLKHQAGQLTNYTSLSKKILVSVDSVRRWIETLKSFYYCFSIQPWTKNITRSLLKEPKIYLWDWSLVEDEGAKIENFIASHLLKAVHFWTDRGLGEYDLYFLRDKEKREVDFLVSKNGKPWFIVEVKKSDQTSLSKNLFYYQDMLQVEHAFQVAFDMPYVHKDCFSFRGPIIVPAKTFLSQLK